MKKNAFFIAGLEIEREFGVPDKTLKLYTPTPAGILEFERGIKINDGMTRKWNCINVIVNDENIR